MNVPVREARKPVKRHGTVVIAEHASFDLRSGEIPRQPRGTAQPVEL